MQNVLSSEIVSLITLILIVLGVLAVVAFRRIIQPRIEGSDLYTRYSILFHVIDDVVSNVVMRLAFSNEDLSAFEEEAERTGRDVRLVAAINYIDRFTNDLGIDLDEEYIISAIEAKLAELKQAGDIPSKSDAA